MVTALGVMRPITQRRRATDAVFGIDAGACSTQIRMASAVAIAFVKQPASHLCGAFGSRWRVR